MDQQLLRSLGIEGDLDVDSSTTKGGPGKSTLTSKLTPAPQVVFRVADPATARALGESFGSGSRPRIQREADGASGGRDGNGVMAGAEAAVDRAASSSGAPLPTHIQRQFEGSLGADLSSVRVHTGGESQEAAHAVGAKAYTVGNDIHFAAGRYQPDDPFGMHLLAHEVAHTVQQSGGAQRRQNKLEVSTPQDSAEHEADLAADAMVRGEAATVSGGNGQVHRRPESHTMFKMDPDDAYTAPPYDFSATPPDHDTVVETPDQVEFKLSPRAPTFRGLRGDEAQYNQDNINLDPALVQKRANSFAAYQDATIQLQNSWNSMAPLVDAYEHALDEVQDGGLLGPAPDGQNWDPNVPFEAQSYGDVADAQKVGDHTKLGDLFADEKGDQKLQGINKDAVNRGTKEEKEAVSKMFENARVADRDVQTAVTAYNTHINKDLKAAALGVQTALNAVEIKSTEDDKDKAAAELKEMTDARAEVLGAITGAAGTYEGIGGAAKTIAAVGTGDVSAILKTAGVVAEAIIGGINDAPLSAAKAKLQSIDGRLAGLKDKSLKLAYDKAMLEFESVEARTGGLVAAINKQLLVRNRAYDDAANAAGKKAGGGADGERIKAAIRALPKVATVLGRLEAVKAAIVLPPYSADAGIGVNAALKQGDQATVAEARWFVKYYAMLKAYKVKYDGLHKQWKQRYQQLDALTKQFNVV
ncbi:MAG: DUF4157 domain-containing protein [Myxococcales bacterium]|nr:DUF4157 domain-containing protein [Myxococcales bacterium]